MADKRDGKPPPIRGDNRNLRMTGDDFPPIGEDALYQRILDIVPTLKQEAKDLIASLNERYSDRD